LRRDDLYLADILEAAEAIAGFLAGRNEPQFVGDDLLRSAVLQKLTVIGEAAARVTRQLRDRHAAVPWQDIVAFRNIAVHHYFGIDWHIVWNAATSDVPALRQEIANVIATLRNGDAP
jgi:uncharacterized protein with HEPN domain